MRKLIFIVVTLPARIPPLCVASLDAAVDTLRRSGVRVDVVHPDEASQAALGAAVGPTSRVHGLER